MVDIHNRDPGFWRGVLRSTITGILVSSFIVTGLLLLLGNTSKDQLEQERRIADNQEAIVQLQEDTIKSQDAARDANLAQGCVLQLPVDPLTGRDASDYAWCFRQYGLPVPDVDGPGGEDAPR